VKFLISQRDAFGKHRVENPVGGYQITIKINDLFTAIGLPELVTAPEGVVRLAKPGWCAGSLVIATAFCCMVRYIFLGDKFLI